MATNDDIDPARSQRLANDQLRVALLQLDEHIQALTAPTMELALVQKKRAVDMGLESLGPEGEQRRFVSSAMRPSIGEPGEPTEPGQLNPDASSAAPILPNQAAWAKYLGQIGGGGHLPPSQMPEAGSPIAGRTNAEASKLEGEEIKIPQFGDWQVDTLLRTGAQVAGKLAMKQYKSQAGQEFSAGETPMSAEEWQATQGNLNSASGVAGLLSKGASLAAGVSLAHKRVLSPLGDIGFGAASTGASLGYSPEGGSFGPQVWHGIPNPLAAFGSAAGRQGLGMTVNAAEAAFGGTGIGLGEANALRSALGQQGWSNQRSGGLFGFTEGGEQETLATALEPLVKKGFKNPEVLAEFTSSLKLGTGTIGELTQGIEVLAETAKKTHQTLEAEAIKAQEFMAKTVEGGSTMMHGLHAYGEIGQSTGMNPLLIQGINEGQFGHVQALSKGIMPWEVAGLTGNAAALNAYETYKKVAGYVPKQSNTETVNKVTGQKEVIESATEKEAAYIHMLEPNMTAEEAKRLKEIGPKLEAVQGGLSQGKGIHAAQFKREEQGISASARQKAEEAQKDHQTAQSRVQQLEREMKSLPSGSTRLAELSEQLEAAKEHVTSTHADMTSALSRVKKAEGLHGNAYWETEAELQGPKGLYATATAAGVTPAELQKIQKESLGKQTGSIMEALENLNKVNVEKENQKNAKIELTPEAARWFKLKFPNAKSPKDEQNAGGRSLSSQAAQPNAGGPTAQEAAALRQFEQGARNEPTAGAL